VPRLIVIHGADEGKQFDLDQEFHGIGREASNAFRLHDTEVSRRHAELRLVNGEYEVADIGSANGTLINGHRVSSAVLRSGDQIQIGQTILVYSAGLHDAPLPSLAGQVHILSRHDVELSTAIVKSVDGADAVRFLTTPAPGEAPWSKSALANLAVMYETAQAISHIMDVDELLQRIMELIFRSIEADRGCIMLRDPEKDIFQPKAIRYREGVNPSEKISVSRTIMEHVLREEQGVLINDAARDSRFRAGQSIVRYGIQEVICVPMKGRHETLGVLYLDTRTSSRDMLQTVNHRSGKFNEEHLTLAVAIGHQAALALEETRYYHAMVQAERLVAVGQTIAALSHHIKNILQGLRSGGEILKMGLDHKDDPMVQKGWMIFDKSQAKIYNLVMDMLSYSKDREPAFESAQLNTVIEEVLETLSGRVKDVGVKLEVRLNDCLPPILMDPDGIQRALLNIVSNALDAVEDGPNPQIAVASSRDPEEGWVRILVIDNGVGIPPERLDDIFKPFVSSKGSKGTGLGLAVSRKIFLEHGGEITVQSTPGKTTTFVMRLPIRTPLHHDMSGTIMDDEPLRLLGSHQES
jgi:signal transduction histidine kinase